MGRESSVVPNHLPAAFAMNRSYFSLRPGEPWLKQWSENTVNVAAKPTDEMLEKETLHRLASRGSAPQTHLSPAATPATIKAMAKIGMNTATTR